jgi:orotidine 5'-phosphate decarboxylase subfamily 2
MTTLSRSPFLERIAERRLATGATLCVGLDPDPAQIPACFGGGVGAIRDYLMDAIDATCTVATAYKPNAAFFEALGREGWELLADTILTAGRHAPVILDAKRSDIGNTAAFYARAAFDQLRADAITLNPLLGEDSITPFLEHRDRGLFVLCATSNPGADDFLLPGGFVERIVERWPGWAARHPAVGLVVGATRPDLLRTIAGRCEAAPLLVPGLGAQGGEAGPVLEIASRRAAPVLINVTRAILYPHPSRGAPPIDTRRGAAEAIHLAAMRWARVFRPGREEAPEP